MCGGLGCAGHPAHDAPRLEERGCPPGCIGARPLRSGSEGRIDALERTRSRRGGSCGQADARACRGHPHRPGGADEARGTTVRIGGVLRPIGGATAIQDGPRRLSLANQVQVSPPDSAEVAAARGPAGRAATELWREIGVRALTDRTPQEGMAPGGRSTRSLVSHARADFTQSSCNRRRLDPSAGKRCLRANLRVFRPRFDESASGSCRGSSDRSQAVSKSHPWSRPPVTPRTVPRPRRARTMRRPRR